MGITHTRGKKGVPFILVVLPLGQWIAQEKMLQKVCLSTADSYPKDNYACVKKLHSELSDSFPFVYRFVFVFCLFLAYSHSILTLFVHFVLSFHVFILFCSVFCLVWLLPFDQGFQRWTLVDFTVVDCDLNTSAGRAWLGEVKTVYDETCWQDFGSFLISHSTPIYCNSEASWPWHRGTSEYHLLRPTIKFLTFFCRLLRYQFSCTHCGWPKIVDVAPCLLYLIVFCICNWHKISTY